MCVAKNYVMRGSIGGVMALVALCALPEWGQGQEERCGYLELPVRYFASSVHEPYTIEYATTSQRLLTDGTTKTLDYTVMAAFDSQGRWMNSRTAVSSPEDESPSTYVCVYDPIAGIRTTWSVPGKEATQMKIAEIESSHSSCVKDKTPDTEVSHSKPVVEDLGSATILGYVAEGFRISRSLPISTSTNGKSYLRKVEIWRAPVPGINFNPGIELTDHYGAYDPWYWSKSEMLENFGQKLPDIFASEGRHTGVLVRSVVEYPGQGKISEELQDIRQGNPDPAVFQPPEGYKIVLKKAPPTVCPAEKTEAPTEPQPAQ